MHTPERAPSTGSKPGATALPLKRRTPRKKSPPAGLVDFDNLPAAALINVHVFALLLNLGVNSIWRKAKAGELPKPVKVGTGATRWRVGAVRNYLASLEESDPPRLSPSPGVTHHG
ncbi:AlpA family transcriptional regulator [Methylococcus sp. EFPC2]|uniref:helix-turn-helix transcriptional regulator n=1 Tax=Methylococcus sp. EFPC2 TaxID=2812648 RepID=UPI001967F207|nr:hypothetical protein [Methylococcus sp. EFPC2]QSA97117.1 hypothetical protein JWZ97_18310 [Methylococcus sp. EFPC2]